jgi:transcriptional regulator of acetoin/glycerol metabolism
VIQEREVRRVGGNARIPIDVRIIAATHRDLEALVASGAFRADLYYRLNVVRVDVPPLRERREDVAPLLDAFAERLGPFRLHEEARDILLAHDWPGNVRELENEVRRLAAIVGRGGEVRAAHLSPAILGRGPAPPADASLVEGVWRLDDVEKEMLVRALRRSRGNKALAARLLGLPKTSFYHRLERHGLHEATGGS